MKHLALLPSAVAIGLILTACGSDDDSTSTTMNMPGDVTTTPTDPTPTDTTTMAPTTPVEAPVDATPVDAMPTQPVAELPSEPPTNVDPPVDMVGTVVDIAVGDENFSQLVAALQSANLVDILSTAGPFTVFAPTDAAFDAFEAANPGVLASLTTEELTSILTYHVVGSQVMSSDLVSGALAETLQGGHVGITLNDSVMINDATVETADIAASNGVIHVIDSIMLPPGGDIVDVALEAGAFTQLAGALTAAGLVDTLKSEGPFTVFAPTDAAFEAFEAANPGVLESLSTEQLTDILLYHVSTGWVGAADLSDGMIVPTQLVGRDLTIDLSNGVRVNTSNVTDANILTSNGVIHVINEILLPPTE